MSFLLRTFLRLAEELGVSLAHEKTESPSTELTFLGIETDTVQQCCRLPVDKLAKLSVLVAKCLAKSKLSLLELQQLAFHLYFACNVVAPGRSFVQHLCDGMAGL